MKHLVRSSQSVGNGKRLVLRHALAVDVIGPFTGLLQVVDHNLFFGVKQIRMI